MDRMEKSLFLKDLERFQKKLNIILNCLDEIKEQFIEPDKTPLLDTIYYELDFFQTFLDETKKEIN